jgi:hypothetical protein
VRCAGYCAFSALQPAFGSFNDAYRLDQPPSDGLQSQIEVPGSRTSPKRRAWSMRRAGATT